MIQVRGLTKIFPGGAKAVDGLDLTVYQGEILGLLGPNGAGKTTTIRALSTLCGFDSGQVIVAGYDVDKEPEKVRQAIGVVAQNTGIDYFLTGRENLELQGHLYRMKKTDIKNRVAELAKYFELEGSLDLQVATYSGGMRRKLDIATALIHHPTLVFLDEPTLGLDIKSRKMLWSLIEKLNKEMGLTILLTTHYLEEADKLANHVAIISAGKVRTVGTPDELKSSIAGEVLTLNFEQKNWPVKQFAVALNQTDYVKDSMWQGDKLYVYVTNGAESVPKITELAKTYSVHILTLGLSRPTLDDVFLKYTGTSMEGTGEESGDEWWKQWAGKGGGGKWAKKWQQAQGQEGGDDESGGWGQWTAEESEQWLKQQGGIAAETDGDGPSEAAEGSGQTGGWGQWSAEETAQWLKQQGGVASGATGGGETAAAEEAEATEQAVAESSGQTGGWGQWTAEEAAQWRKQQAASASGEDQSPDPIPGTEGSAEQAQPREDAGSGTQHERPLENKKWADDSSKK